MSKDLNRGSKLAELVQGLVNSAKDTETYRRQLLELCREATGEDFSKFIDLLQKESRQDNKNCFKFDELNVKVGNEVKSEDTIIDLTSEQESLSVVTTHSTPSCDLMTTTFGMKKMVNKNGREYFNEQVFKCEVTSPTNSHKILSANRRSERIKNSVKTVTNPTFITRQISSTSCTKNELKSCEPEQQFIVTHEEMAQRKSVPAMATESHSHSKSLQTGKLNRNLSVDFPNATMMLSPSTHAKVMCKLQERGESKVDKYMSQINLTGRTVQERSVSVPCSSSQTVSPNITQISPSVQRLFGKDMLTSHTPTSSEHNWREYDPSQTARVTPSYKKTILRNIYPMVTQILCTNEHQEENQVDILDKEPNTEHDRNSKSQNFVNILQDVKIADPSCGSLKNKVKNVTSGQSEGKTDKVKDHEDVISDNGNFKDICFPSDNMNDSMDSVTDGMPSYFLKSKMVSDLKVTDSANQCKRGNDTLNTEGGTKSSSESSITNSCKISNRGNRNLKTSKRCTVRGKIQELEVGQTPKIAPNQKKSGINPQTIELKIAENMKVPGLSKNVTCETIEKEIVGSIKNQPQKQARDSSRSITESSDKSVKKSIPMSPKKRILQEYLAPTKESAQIRECITPTLKISNVLSLNTDRARCINFNTPQEKQMTAPCVPLKKRRGMPPKNVETANQTNKETTKSSKYTDPCKKLFKNQSDPVLKCLPQVNQQLKKLISFLPVSKLAQVSTNTSTVSSQKRLDTTVCSNTDTHERHNKKAAKLQENTSCQTQEPSSLNGNKTVIQRQKRLDITVSSNTNTHERQNKKAAKLQENTLCQIQEPSSSNGNKTVIQRQKRLDTTVCSNTDTHERQNKKAAKLQENTSCQTKEPSSLNGNKTVIQRQKRLDITVCSNTDTHERQNKKATKLQENTLCQTQEPSISNGNKTVIQGHNKQTADNLKMNHNDVQAMKKDKQDVLISNLDVSMPDNNEPMENVEQSVSNIEESMLDVDRLLPNKTKPIQNVDISRSNVGEYIHNVDKQVLKVAESIPNKDMQIPNAAEPIPNLETQIPNLAFVDINMNHKSAETETNNNDFVTASSYLSETDLLQLKSKKLVMLLSRVCVEEKEKIPVCSSITSESSSKTNLKLGRRKNKEKIQMNKIKYPRRTVSPVFESEAIVIETGLKTSNIQPVKISSPVCETETLKSQMSEEPTNHNHEEEEIYIDLTVDDNLDSDTCSDITVAYELTESNSENDNVMIQINLSDTLLVQDFGQNRGAKPFTVYKKYEHENQKEASLHEICIICGMEFYFVRDLNFHMSQFHQVIQIRKTISCDKCVHHIPNRIQESIGCGKCEGNSLAQCPICSAKFDNYESLHLHIDSSHPYEYALGTTKRLCIYCGKLLSATKYIVGTLIPCFVPKDPLEKLENVKYPSLVCATCSVPCDCATEVRDHKLVHGETRVNDFVCYKCKIPFSQQSELVDHVWVHYEVTPYRCRFCEKYCKCKMQLKTHELSHVPKSK